MEILRALYHGDPDGLLGGDDDAIIRAVDLITGHLAVCAARPQVAALQVSGEAGRGHRRSREDDAGVRHFVERTIAIGFDGPDIRGVSEEWQTYVNPHHLPCLRTWLAIIESDPIKYEQLLSALVINLHLEGVFVPTPTSSSATSRRC